MTAQEVNKPPLGVIPEWFWRYSRLKELTRAISERINHDTGGLYIEFPIPNEWFIEYGEHVSWFSKNNPEQLIDFIYET